MLLVESHIQAYGKDVRLDEETREKGNQAAISPKADLASKERRELCKIMEVRKFRK